MRLTTTMSSVVPTGRCIGGGVTTGGASFKRRTTVVASAAMIVVDFLPDQSTLRALAFNGTEKGRITVDIADNSKSTFDASSACEDLQSHFQTLITENRSVSTEQMAVWRGVEAIALGLGQNDTQLDLSYCASLAPLRAFAVQKAKYKKKKGRLVLSFCVGAAAEDADTSNLATAESKRRDSHQTSRTAPALPRRNAATDTAFHVLKGAVVAVLGPAFAVTNSVEWISPTSGTLQVVVRPAAAAGAVLDKPVDEAQQLAALCHLAETKRQAIEEAANGVVAKDVEVSVRQWNRDEAELHYTKNVVNDTFIYDNFPVPAHVKQLLVVEIQGWNVNCCIGPHAASTSSVGHLTIDKIRVHSAKGWVDFRFSINPNHDSSPAAAKAQL